MYAYKQASGAHQQASEAQAKSAKFHGSDKGERKPDESFAKLTGSVSPSPPSLPRKKWEKKKEI